MNQGRYFIPNMGMGMSQPFTLNSGFVFRNNLFSRLVNGIKNFNWGGLLNGANSTLNVVNQTIPLIRQTKPMINNVKNMINLTKAFRKETVKSIKTNSSYKNIEENSITKKEVITDNYPNFFI